MPTSAENTTDLVISLRTKIPEMVLAATDNLGPIERYTTDSMKVQYGRLQHKPENTGISCYNYAQYSRNADYR